KDHPTTLTEDIEPSLREGLKRLHLESAIVGFELQPVSQEASYIASMHYCEGLADLACTLYPNVIRRSADNLFARERSVLTTHEQSRVRLAAAIAEKAFEEG